MKFHAHPLVVAAALGLIGPGAVDDEDEPEAGALCDGCAGPPDPAAPTDDEGIVVVEPAEEWTWSPGAPPDPEAFHRVELAWLKESQGR